MTESLCCFITDQKAITTCNQKADWRIQYDESPDGYTEACTEHVGQLLADQYEQIVYKIKPSARAQPIVS